jgi:Phospholipase_D-nuclease N-terminal
LLDDCVYLPSSECVLDDGRMFLFVIWFWLLIVVFGDIFRSHDMGGWAKAQWVIFVVVIPFLGMLVYLIARGGKMQERSVEQAQRQQEAFDAQIRQAAGSSGSADQFAKLADLNQKGVLMDAEFQAQKAKLLG